MRNRAIHGNFTFSSLVLGILTALGGSPPRRAGDERALALGSIATGGAGRLRSTCYGAADTVDREIE